MNHDIKLTEDDVKFLTKSLRPSNLIKFDIVLNAISSGESKTLEELESEYGIYFNEEGEKLLSEILKKHGYRMRKFTITRIDRA